MLVTLAFGGALVWRRYSPRAARRDLKIVDKLITELKASAQVSGEMSLERAFRIARRITSHISGRNVLELTSDELRASVTEETPETLKSILDAVASLEELGYSPASPDRDASARALSLQLADLIEEYRNQRRPR